MVYKTLDEMITYLEYGTKLHIGVLFYGNYGNEMCALPQNRYIHLSPLCDKFKTQSSREYARCFACRKLALKKAPAEKKAFFGLCINGICEYTRPVIIGGNVACIIYIGNILDESNSRKIRSRTADEPELLNSLETGLSKKDIETICDLIEGHILMLLEKFPGDQTGNPLIKNIKNYIIDNLEYDINIALIADMFHYNPLYLGRLFKKETGSSITDFINAQRLNYAAQLLRETGYSILSVAGRTGFNNVTYFNRLFKHSYGISPKDYRAQNAEKK